VSSEWFSRPADERYLSVTELLATVRGRAERSRARTAESAAIRVDANRDDAGRLALMLPGEDVPLVLTHWSFGQLATLVGAPAAYLRQLPAPLAGVNLQYGLTSHRAELIKTLEVEKGHLELHAVAGPDYGRIYKHELVAAVQRIAGDGTGDTRWKVPDVLDWSKGIYNPIVDIAAAGWSPTIDNYLGRVTKARTLQAVREARGQQGAQLIDHLKKGEMTERAQELLAGSGWLPEPLRTPGRAITVASPIPDDESTSPIECGEESATTGCETAMANLESSRENQPVATEPPAVAAE
jgi:hypothetical protein